MHLQHFGHREARVGAKGGVGVGVGKVGRVRRRIDTHVELGVIPAAQHLKGAARYQVTASATAGSAAVY